MSEGLILSGIIVFILIGITSFYAYSCYFSTEKAGFCRQIFGLCYNPPSCIVGQKVNTSTCACENQIVTLAPSKIKATPSVLLSVPA